MRCRKIRMLFLLVISHASASAFAAVIHVGPQSTYEKPSQAAAVARDGDTVEIEAAEYVGDVAVWTQTDIVLRGIGGRPHLEADGNSAEGKAIWVIKGDNTIIENIEFSGAAVPDQNGAGIRLEGTNLTIRKCRFHDNENGILTGANPKSEILIEYSEFSKNGHGDGYSHNIYIGRVAKFTLQFSYVHHARVGHQVKSRAEENNIMFNRLMDERKGYSSYIIDLPDPGKAYVVGNELQQGPNAENWAIVHSNQTLHFINNTVVNDRDNGIFVKFLGGGHGSVLQNNIFAGRGKIEGSDAVFRNNLTSNDIGFVNRDGYNYGLSEWSPAIDKGASLDTDIELTSEYVHVAGRKDRQKVRAVDIGAHAYVSLE